MKDSIYILLAIVISMGVFIKLTSKKQTADLLLINATIYTVDDKNSVAEAVAIRGNRIIAVGSSKDIENHYTSQNIIDVHGKTIVPGFIDSHAHVFGLGCVLTELNLVGTTSPEQIAKLVAEKAKQLKEGEWIRGRGWDQNDWGASTEEKPFPTSAILDKVAPKNPVILTRIDGHAIWVNGKAMEIAAKQHDLKNDVNGGRIIRNRFGIPSGIFIDKAQALIENAVNEYSKSVRQQIYRRAFNECLKYGITSVHDMGIDRNDFDIYKEFCDTQSLPIRIYALIDGTGPFLNEMLESGPSIDAVHYQLTLRSIKLYMDGALGSRGAALIEPYSDEPENNGLIRLEPDSVRIVTEQALEKGFQVCVHAIGDRANKLVLDEYEKAGEHFPLKAHTARLRIEHAQILTPEDIPRFKKLNVIPSMQPTHATSDMYWAQARLGPERIRNAYAWRSLLDEGNIIACGSDFPVEHPNPLFGFYAAIIRQDKNGIPNTIRDVKEKFQLSADGVDDPKLFEGGWYPEQRLTREEALRSFTIWGAYAEFSSHQKGSIEEGKLADIVVLSKDIIKIEPKEILTTEIEMTIVDGDVRYKKPD